MKKITAIFFCTLLGFAGLKIGLSSNDQFTLVPTQTITAGTISSMPFDLQMSRMMKAVRQAVNEEVKTDTVYITEKCNKKPRKIRVPYEVVKHDTVYGKRLLEQSVYTGESYGTIPRHNACQYAQE